MSQSFACAFLKQSVNGLFFAQHKFVTMHNMAGISWSHCLLSFYQDHVPRRSQQLGTASCSGRGFVVYHMDVALDAHDIAAVSTNLLLQHLPCLPCFQILKQPTDLYCNSEPA